MESTLAKTTSERKKFPWAYSVSYVHLFTHSKHMAWIRTTKKSEFGHRLNETINSGSLNVPEKQI